MAAMNNMKQIGFALQSYAQDHYGRLPPAALCDGDGKPLLSWRVLILPYLEQGNLYRQFHLDEAWDGPHNIALLSSMPKIYHAWGGLPVEVRAGPDDTFYQAFTGVGTAFEGLQGLRLPEDFPDGTSNTILLVEAGEAVPWTKPADLLYEADRPLPPLGGVFTGEGRFSLFGPNRVKGFHVCLADGSVRFIRPTTGESTLRDAITRNDGKTPGLDW